MNRRALGWIVAACLSAGLAYGQDIVADIEEGTNMALALSPDGETLIVDLMGRLWTLPATGGAASPLLGAESVARNPRYSPDGRAVVYQQLSQGQWDLWLLDLASSTRRRLTGPPYDEREPDFSAQGDTIYFASSRGEREDIWRLSLDTEAIAQVTFDERSAAWPSVSERGEIAYVAHAADRWALVLAAPDRAPIELYSSPFPLRAPSWRPGGGVLVFTEQASADESSLRMILLAEDRVTKTLTFGEDVFGFRAAWKDPGTLLYSADGRLWWRTLANAQRYPIPLFAGIAVALPAQPLQSTISPDDGPYPVQGIRAPVVSPSGRLLAFTALGDLWLAEGDEAPRQLTNDEYLDIDPEFSPDERTLVFASDRDGTMNLWSFDLSDDTVAQVTMGPAKAYAPSLSPDGTRLAYLETEGFGPWGPSRLRLLDLRASTPPETLAIQLRDASRPSWAASGRVIELVASDGERVSAPQDGKARLQIEIADRSARWTPLADTAEPATERMARHPELDWQPTAPSGRYVIQAGRLFDGVRTDYRRHMDIHIEGARIADVVTRGLAPLPETVIDARGYTVLPGLIDLHAHQSALAGERLGRAWLAYGVTTVRELNGQPEDSLERREAWTSGKRLGPRLFLSATLADVSVWPGSTAANRPSYDVLEVVDVARGPAANAAIAGARRLGLPIFSTTLYPTANVGANALEHLGRPGVFDPYDLERSALGQSYEDVLTVLRQTGTALIPTLAAAGGFAALAGTRPAWVSEPAFTRLFSRDERLTWLQQRNAGLPHGAQRTVAELVRGGGRVATGSDAPSVPYGLGMHAELSLLSAAGLPNDQALRLATTEAALALGLERDLGTVESGKLADLVVIDGNPLNSIADTLRIVAVVKDGRWFDREELLRAD